MALSVMRTARQYGEARLHLIEDLCQEAYLKLWRDQFRLLIEFAERHPDAVIGYIKVTAANVANDHFKALHRLKRPPPDHKQGLDRDEIPDASGPQSVYSQVLFHEIYDQVRGCTKGPHQDRDFLIFRLHYKLGVSAKDIARIRSIGLSSKGVEVVLAKITETLRKHLIETSESRK